MNAFIYLFIFGGYWMVIFEIEMRKGKGEYKWVGKGFEWRIFSYISMRGGLLDQDSSECKYYNPLLIKSLIVLPLLWGDSLLSLHRNLFIFFKSIFLLCIANWIVFGCKGWYN